MYLKSEHSCLLPYPFHSVSGLSSDPPRHRKYRGGGGGAMETTGDMRQIEITEKNSLFY